MASSSSAAILAHARALRLPFTQATCRPSLCTCTAIRREVEAPNLAQLCDKARISLSPKEIEEFTPQIARVVDWFAQLQDVDVENVEPAVRVGVLDSNSTMREDKAVVFEQREEMLASIPQREGPYMIVPKILKENVE